MTARPDDPSVGQLVGSIREDVAALVRGELDLAKAELRESAARAGTGTGLVALAGYLIAVATILLAFAAAYGLVAAGLGLGWAFLIVAGAYVVLAVILGLIARNRFRGMRGPERAKRSAGLLGTALRPGSRAGVGDIALSGAGVDLDRGRSDGRGRAYGPPSVPESSVPESSVPESSVPDAAGTGSRP